MNLKRVLELMQNHQNIAMEHKMTLSSNAQSANMQINKSLSLLFTIHLFKCLLNLLEFNFLIKIIKLKYGVKIAKSFTQFQQISFHKIIDSIMELLLLIMICICLINFIPIKLDILNLHKTKDLAIKMFLIRIMKIKQKIQLYYY